jgi:GntR family transcriptional repressor for pyruvate dehydrogenase complex
MDEPIERRTVYELVAERLLEHISQRRLRPGDALPTERELTQVYRVGRSSVREALRMLQSNGLIKPAGKGVFVVAEFANPLNHSLHLLLTLRETDLRELFEVRKILEGETAALAAARRTDEDLAQMERAIVEMVEGLAAQD